MPSIAILREAEQLYSVSDRLDSLAGAISRRLRSTHHHLRKRSYYGNFDAGSGRNENRATLRLRSSRCL